jgi:hypothetical protein
MFFELEQDLALHFPSKLGRSTVLEMEWLLAFQ